MNANQQINLNQVSDCIRQVSGLGQNTYYNICNQTHFSVPWGALDWCQVWVGGILIVSMLVFFVWLFQRQY